MCDTSEYTLEQRIVVSAWVHERPHTGKTLREVRADFQQRFHKEAPPKQTLLRWEHKLFETGNIKDKPRTGRPSTRVQQCQDVEESVMRSPKKSLRKRSAELGIPRSTLHKHMKNDLHLHAYRPMFVQELSDNDLARRRDACALLLQTFDTIPKRGKVIFSDECAIYRSCRSRNVVFWSKENPHYVEELEHNPPHVMIWAAMNSRHLFGPYFFDGTVNQTTYLDMLRTWFVPQLEELGILNGVWFQQDGAPAHYAISVREYLAEVFRNRWIGRGSALLPAPLAWPPRSPDLSTCDNSLWGFIKECVAQQRYETTNDLKEAVRMAFARISPQMLRTMSHRTWRKIILCHENEGAQTDPLDT